MIWNCSEKAWGAQSIVAYSASGYHVILKDCKHRITSFGLNELMLKLLVVVLYQPLSTRDCENLNKKYDSIHSPNIRALRVIKVPTSTLAVLLGPYGL